MGQGRGLVLVLVATRSSGDCVEQTGRTPTRTSTRPPHSRHPAPCPYRTLGRKHLNGYDSPIRSSKFIMMESLTASPLANILEICYPPFRMVKFHLRGDKIWKSQSRNLPHASVTASRSSMPCRNAAKRSPPRL